MTMTEQETYAEKIAKLLRKAESTTPEEAESLIAKAQELMLTYAIDADMIARAAGKQVDEKIIEAVMSFTGIFQSVTMNMGFAVARTNNCRAFYSKVEWARPTRHDLHVFGFESDVERVKLLTTSLEVQMAAALNTWWKENRERYSYSKMAGFKARREFILGYIASVANKLTEAKRAAERQAVTNEAERSNVAADEATTSVALVLRSKKEQVDDWYDERYGKTLRTVSRRFQSGGMSARVAGQDAGARADVGQPSVGNRKGLNR